MHSISRWVAQPPVYFNVSEAPGQAHPSQGFFVVFFRRVIEAEKQQPRWYLLLEVAAVGFSQKKCQLLVSMHNFVKQFKT